VREHDGGRRAPRGGEVGERGGEGAAEWHRPAQAPDALADRPQPLGLAGRSGIGGCAGEGGAHRQPQREDAVAFGAAGAGRPCGDVGAIGRLESGMTHRRSEMGLAANVAGPGTSG
jgi:hypothetical protein